MSARGVAGLAIETEHRLPSVPVEMVEDAERLGLPPIERRKFVPFVAVTEAINGLLVTSPCAVCSSLTGCHTLWQQPLAAGG